jgi:hypothetical protein
MKRSAQILLGVALGGVLVAAACSTEVTDDGSGGAGASGGAGGAGATGGSGGTDFAACNGPGQCMVAIPGCCGVCGQPTLADVEPINRVQGEAFFHATCPDPEGEPCPGCPSAPNPALFAFCSEQDRCVAADWNEHPLNSCEQASDCRLRVALDCCECGGSLAELVAVPVDGAALSQLICPADRPPCPPCAPEYPPEAMADCVEGRCVVTVLE